MRIAARSRLSATRFTSTFVIAPELEWFFSCAPLLESGVWFSDAAPLQLRFSLKGPGRIFWLVAKLRCREGGRRQCIFPSFDKTLAQTPKWKGGLDLLVYSGFRLFKTIAIWSSWSLSKLSSLGPSPWKLCEEVVERTTREKLSEVDPCFTKSSFRFENWVSFF